MTSLLRTSPDTKLPLARHVSRTTLAVGVAAIVALAAFHMPMGRLAIGGMVETAAATVRAPISGEADYSTPRLDVGMAIMPDDAILRATSRRGAGSGLEDLARQLEQLHAERPVIAARLDRARAALASVTEQMQTFVEARVLQLEARQDELEAELAAARARNLEAQSSLNRAIDLTNKGWRTKAQLDQVHRDSTVAERLEAAAQKRLEAVGVELAAARRGVFIAASADHLRYQQRADHLEAEVHKLDAALADHDRRITNLAGDLASEETRGGGQS
jgi:hypothetical protein